MSNRETYPSQLFPLRGDVSAEAGDTSVTVVGIQTTPVESTAPTDGNALVAFSGEWVLHTLDGSIMVNGLPKSDDYDVGVNLTLGISDSPLLVNGS
jgi:hypothetical protein